MSQRCHPGLDPGSLGATRFRLGGRNDGIERSRVGGRNDSKRRLPRTYASPNDAVSRTKSNLPHNPFSFQQGCQLAGLGHFPHNVTAANELTLDVKLRNRRPLSEIFDALA
jgi:hypothetical protein